MSREDDMSLRPRPGETPEQTVARVIAAANSPKFSEHTLIGPEDECGPSLPLKIDARIDGEDPDPITVLVRWQYAADREDRVTTLVVSIIGNTRNDPVEVEQVPYSSAVKV